MEKSVAAIEQWLKAVGMTESRLGLLACANAYAVARIRSGTASIRTLQEVIDYITDNPPNKKAKK